MRLRTLLATIGLAAFTWVTFHPPSCGDENAVECPPPKMANGLDSTLSRRQACSSAGYLCSGRDRFQVRRWALERGRLRVRVPPPPVEDRDERRRLHDAAVAGILQWDGHPFPLQIDRGRFPRRPWDIQFYWVPRTAFGDFGGSGGNHAGVAYSEWSEQGGKPEFSVHGISTVAFRDDGRGNPVPAETQHVVSVSAHEMGHALGLPHSDQPTDVMTPSTATLPDASIRDLRTVHALYGLPNGARVTQR